MSRFTGAGLSAELYRGNPAAYLAEVKKLGLDMPLFYFELTNAAFPDTLYRIFPFEDREHLAELTRQSGNWPATSRLWQAVTTELDPDLERISGPALVGFKNLRNLTGTDKISSALKNLAWQVDTIRAEPLRLSLKNRLANIEKRLAELQMQRQIWKLYVPTVHWYGHQNQYHRWISGFITGNPGNSIVTGKPLLEELRPRLLTTLILNGAAMLLAFLIGVPLGVWMARRQGRPEDVWMRTLLLFLYAIPVIWLGSLLIILLSRQDIGLGCIEGLNAEPWSMSGKPFWTWAWDSREKFVLPVLTLTLHLLALMAMQMRGGILEVVKQDFIRTARAKGLSENLVYWRHAFRNALFPVITLFAGLFPAIFSGSLVLEYLFDFPGMGIKMQTAFINNDYAVLFAMVMFVAVITILSNVLADLLYAWADPRVRLEKR
ncbi:MAG: ABC transporter permease [Thermoanaerobaculia bacterium]|nr:ABC transporter permease [Thermoanaerobaculia bacterium]